MVYTEIFQRCEGLHLLGRNVFYPLRPPPLPDQLNRVPTTMENHEKPWEIKK